MSSTRSDGVEAPPPGRYVVDPDRSSVAYTSKHMFGLGTVHATFAVASGRIEVGDPVSASTVDVVVDAASFSSGSRRRDNDVRSRGLLDVATYPEIRFSSTAARAEDGRLTVPGTVTAHGRTAPVELVVHDLRVVGDALVARGGVEHLDRFELGVTGSRGLVGRYIDLVVEVHAERDDEASP